MARELVIRPRAREDLRSIYEFIAEDSPARALSFVEAIEKRGLSLLDFPEQGRVRDDLQAGIRILLYGRSVVIAYTISATAVEIARVFYGGQDFETSHRRLSCGADSGPPRQCAHRRRELWTFAGSRWLNNRGQREGFRRSAGRRPDGGRSWQALTRPTIRNRPAATSSTSPPARSARSARRSPPGRSSTR